MAWQIIIYSGCSIVLMSVMPARECTKDVQKGSESLARDSFRSAYGGGDVSDRHRKALSVPRRWANRFGPGKESSTPGRRAHIPTYRRENELHRDLVSPMFSTAFTKNPDR